MAGFGRFTRKNSYRQENAMGNAGALTQLLGMRANELNNIGNIVDQQGQNMARQKLAALMGSDEYQKMNPEQAQAAALMATNGRTLGKRGEAMLKQSYNDKGDIQSNNWKEDAATTLFGRQNALVDKRFANSQALESMRNKNRLSTGSALAKLRGETINPGESAHKQLFMEALAKEPNQQTRNKMVQEGFLAGLLNKNDRIAMEKTGIIQLPGSKGKSNTKTKKAIDYPGWSNDMRAYINGATAKSRGFLKSKDESGNTYFIDEPTGERIDLKWIKDLYSTLKQ